MATTKKKKGSKRRPKKSDLVASTDDVVANHLLDPFLLGVQNVPEPSSTTGRPEISIPPVRTKAISRKVMVRNIPDPTAKKSFNGRKSMNLQYGPNKISIVKGKQSKIPVGAIDHCRKLGLI